MELYYPQNVSMNRDNYVILQDGYIQQDVPTAPGHKYRVQFYTTSLGQSEYYSQTLGYVRLPGNHQHFSLSPTHVEDAGVKGHVEGLDLDRHPGWIRHVFYLTAPGNLSTVLIGSEGRRNRFAVDEVSVVDLTVEEPYPGDDISFDVHVTSVGDVTTVTASWDVIDPESQVTKNIWAIGSVRGRNIVFLFNLYTYTLYNCSI